MTTVLELDLDAGYEVPAEEDTAQSPRQAALTVDPEPEPGEEPAEAVRLALLDGFALSTGGNTVEISLAGQRLLAFLAVHERPIPRSYAAACLWSEDTLNGAAASLRAAVVSLRQTGLSLIEEGGSQLRLPSHISVDVRDAFEAARKLLDPRSKAVDGDFDDFLRSGDILPDWEDEWVVFERERLRQLRLHALETLCARLTAAGRLAEAIDVALAAVAADPLRESAHRVLISAHLAEGNRAEAVRQFDAYRQMLWRDYGIAPSVKLTTLMADGLAEAAETPKDSAPRVQRKPRAREKAVTEPPPPRNANGQFMRRQAR